MLKKAFDFGSVYFLIAVLFAIGAMARTVSDSISVIVMQWLCAAAFAFMGALRLKKKI